MYAGRRVMAQRLDDGPWACDALPFLVRLDAQLWARPEPPRPPIQYAHRFTSTSCTPISCRHSGII